MKTLALFGGTGKTGSIVLKKALERGYRVKALMRNPAKNELRHELLQVIKGDVLHQPSVEETVRDSDVVLSLFGQVKGSPKDLQTRGTEQIVAAMKKHDVPRIISLSGGGMSFPEKDQPKLPDKIIKGIMKLAVPHILKDAEQHHQVLANSGLKWVIARGPRLTLEPEKGQYRVGWVGVNASTKIGRADLADFLLRLVEDQQYDGQMPFVSY